MLFWNWVMWFFLILFWCRLKFSRNSSQFHGLGHNFSRLTWVDSSFYFVFFLSNFFSISSPNIEFAENWASLLFFLFSFSISLSHSYNMSRVFNILTQVNFFQVFFEFHFSFYFTLLDFFYLAFFIPRWTKNIFEVFLY
jgi:hypothetical protein